MLSPLVKVGGKGVVSFGDLIKKTQLAAFFY
jgi:hypothetical protein